MHAAESDRRVGARPAGIDARVGAWPDRPLAARRRDGCDAPGVAHAFPSGRAALVTCLDVLGVGPRSVVATPECVTACVANAVRRLARPMPIQPALQSDRRALGAVIVYEQWGWPLSSAGQDDVIQRLDGVPVIVDRVDSADFFFARRPFGAFDVLSLSKTLGLAAGGLARHLPGGAFARFEQPDRETLDTPERLPLLHPAVRELFKQSQTVHPSVIGWLQDDNCPILAAEAERVARNQTARAILHTQLSDSWPAWMASAVEAGAGPVWAPVLRGGDAGLHWRALAHLAHAAGINAAVRPFNWSGNPLAPRFESCVALPIHSGVPSGVVALLARALA